MPPASRRSRPAVLLAILLAMLCAVSRAPAAAPEIAWLQPEPSPAEQVFLELINRARANPPAEGLRLAAVTDRELLANYAYFHVDKVAMANAFSRYPAHPPLAMNARLLAAARVHSLDMAASGIQQHGGTNGSTFDERIGAEGYEWAVVGENVYGWVPDPFFGHVGFNVDWGVPGLDHRANIMGLPAEAPEYKEVGISYVPTSRRDFGPNVVTEDFATPADETTAFILGVVFNDANQNGSYDPGEGLPGVTITPEVGPYYAVTPAAGGYVIPLPPTGSGTMTITAAGGGLGAPRVKKIAWIAGTNVKVDFTTADPVAAPPVVTAAPVPPAAS